MQLSATFVALSFLAIGIQAHPLPGSSGLQLRQQSSKLTVFEACSADSDCQQGCCGFTSGKCAGPAVAQTNGSGGCGHGNTSPNCNVAAALSLSDCIAGAAAPDTTDPGVQAAAVFVSQLDNIPFTPAAGGANVVNPPHNIVATPGDAPPPINSASQQNKLTVFETCSADSDCQQGCCGFTSGKCAGPAVAQTNGSGGCGHGNTSPNCNVAAALNLSDCIAGAAAPDTTDAGVQAAAAFVSKLDNIPFTPARK
ncbi:hypothetical protein DFH06DRAFT_1305898 [Mycena polygramma]|nr:hypothetical protein DFH06DRAFT_1305898 [Mycena polygramma]